MSKANQLIPDDYASLLAEVKERVRAAQYAALKSVNKELVALYWDIGRMTTERQAIGEHGTAVVKRLAMDLQAEFPGIVGFSWRNLFNMSEFFAAYRDKPKLQPLTAIIGEHDATQLSPSHHRRCAHGNHTDLLSRSSRGDPCRARPYPGGRGGAERRV